ncbi:MAG: hypothetical protein LBG52_00110 [Candidatus Peribacteria bacterium]|nr:hypothetical protein [Candidatus Peribacteria bacterium]
MKVAQLFFKKGVFLVCLVLSLIFGNIQDTNSLEATKFEAFHLEQIENFYKSGDELHVEGSPFEEQFILHSWVTDYLLSQYNILTIASALPEIPVSKFDSNRFMKSPFCSPRELGAFDKLKITYDKFLAIEYIQSVRNKYDLMSLLFQLDCLLADIILQERILEKDNSLKSLLTTRNDKLKNSFFDIRRNLLLLRHDVELATIIKNKLFEKEKNIIRPYVGRIFFVEKKGPVRIVGLVGSGTIININGKKFILTCRHLKGCGLDSELEVYFVPDYFLNEQDFLPKERSDSAGKIVDWDKFQHCRIKSMIFLNSKDMASTIKLKDAEIEIVPEGLTVLDQGQIQKLMELKDAKDNNDILFLRSEISDALQGCEIIPYASNIDIEKNAYAAGYPGAGMADYSFIAVKSSGSDFYKKALIKTGKEPNWDYEFSSFPVTHGMSGGAVFVIDEKTGTPFVFAALTGANLQNACTLCSIVKMEFLEKIKSL